MSDSESGRPPSAVGVTGTGAEEIADLVAAAGGNPVVDTPETVLDADPALDAVVAGGESAARAVAVADADAPVLAVDAGRGLCSVSRADLPSAIDRLLAGTWDVQRRLVLDVTAGERTARSLLDVTLMTSRPARISEYGVESATDGDVEPFRADGVVVATPAGSHGYARDAGGPSLSPAVDGGAVVPIAPFAIDQRRWVLDFPLTLTVERDTPVDLFVDGERVAAITPGVAVDVRTRARAPFVAVPERTPFFG